MDNQPSYLQRTQTDCICFHERRKMSNKINLNKARMQYKLTRRETDVVRRVLDGAGMKK